MTCNDVVRNVAKSLSIYERVSFKRAGEVENPIFLDANENFFIDVDWLRKGLNRCLRTIDLRFYPDPYCLPAIKTISEFLKIDEENVVVGNGSDQLIDVMVKTFIDKCDEGIVHDPTFGMYRYFLTLGGGRAKSVLLRKDFSLDADAIFQAQTKRTKIVFICSPNNPTGNQFSPEIVRKVVDESRGIVVIDETYADFAKYSVLDMIERYDNLIILKTFSKSFGLAGLRIGFGVANGELINYLKKSCPPYSVNTIAQMAVSAFLGSWEYFKEKFEEVKRERQRLFLELSKVNGLKPYPSDANFILVKITGRGLSSWIVQDRLAKLGIFVSNISKAPLCENCLRITVGTPEMNERLLTALRLILED